MRNAALGLLTCFMLGACVHVQAGAGCGKGCSDKTRGQLLDHHVTAKLSAAAFAKLLEANPSGRQLA
jgi:hypothetical protein